MPHSSIDDPPRSLAIEYVAIDQLIRDARNPRVHSKKQLGQITANIRRHGFLFPITVDGQNRIICGHGRHYGAKAAGLSEIPVVRVEDLTPAQIRAIQISDNKLCENASWDERLLGEALRDLTLEGLDLEVDLTGFEVAEVDRLILNLDEDPDDPDDDPPPSGPAVARRGDLWEVLGHRILCGDALDAASYVALMDGEIAAATITDPPFNVRIQGNAAGFGKTKYAEFAQASGEMSEAEFTDFQITACQRIAEVSADGALAYVFTDWRHLFEAIVAGRRAFAGQRNLCVWAKASGGQGSFYRSQHELVLVWTAKPGKPRNNIQLGRYGRNRTNLWTCAGPSTFGRADDDGNPRHDHPTPKPVALIAEAILDCTARGELVLDPFLGGGAALLAAERTGRRCRGIEIEPKFVDAALRRLRRLTGEDARRVGDGRCFSDLEREAANG